MTIKTLNKWFREHYPNYLISITREDDIYKATITFDQKSDIIALVTRSKRLGDLKTRVLEYLDSNADKVLNLVDNETN